MTWQLGELVGLSLPEADEHQRASEKWIVVDAREWWEMWHAHLGPHAAKEITACGGGGAHRSLPKREKRTIVVKNRHEHEPAVERVPACHRNCRGGHKRQP